MADGASPTLPPKEAIALGLKYFTELMESQPTKRVLLEGLRLDEDKGNWVVTFGFDSARKVEPSLSELERSVGGSLANLIRRDETEILREFRAVHLSSTSGDFVKLEHA